MPVLQLLFAAAACLGLWRLARAQPKIVIAGFLVRAVLGQLLFWISYLQLPFGRSLQLGNGFWFFAIDGPFYLGYARKLAANGPLAILRDAHEYPSHFFVQVLSVCVGFFGGVASVAILLNCAAYLLTCVLIVRLAPNRSRIALAAMACSPASILFSLQPLKDTLFLLLMVAMVALCRRWEEMWRGTGARATFLRYALTLAAILFAISGIRWYLSVIALGSAAFFLLLIVLQGQRKAWGLAASAVMLIVMAQAIRLGASDLPVTYDRLLNPMTALEWRPAASQEHLAVVRQGFDSTPGATSIGEGDALARLDRAPAEVAESVSGGVPAQQVAPPAPTSTAATGKIAEPEVAGQPDIAPAPPASGAPPSLPSRFASRIITGFSAMFLPRLVGEALGVIRIGGGRGLWLFAEVDTIVFGLVLLAAIVHCARGLRSGRLTITATFVFCLLLFVLTAGPMLYTVSNFGTLFRLRLMAYCVAVVLPLTLRERETGRLGREHA